MQSSQKRWPSLNASPQLPSKLAPRSAAACAAQLGYRVIGYGPAGDNIAADMCVDFIEGGWGDTTAISEFASRCERVTWEFENVPLAAVEVIPEKV